MRPGWTPRGCIRHPREDDAVGPHFAITRINIFRAEEPRASRNASSLTPCRGSATTGETQPITADRMKASAKKTRVIIRVLPLVGHRAGNGSGHDGSKTNFRFFTSAKAFRLCA